MNPHYGMLNDIKRSAIYQEMHSSGFVSLRVAEDGASVIFDSPFIGKSAPLSLDSKQEIEQALSEINARKSQLGFTTGYRLDRISGKARYATYETKSGETKTKILLNDTGEKIKGGTFKSVEEKLIQALPPSYRSRMGFYRNQRLVNLDREGYTIERETYKITSENEQHLMKYMEERFISEGKMKGVIYRSGSGGVTAVRIGRRNASGEVDEWLNIDEAYEKLTGMKWGEESGGMTLEKLLGKGSKRIRGAMQDTMLSASFKPEEIKVHVFDPAEIFQNAYKEALERHTKNLVAHYEKKGILASRTKAEISKIAESMATEEVSKFVDGTVTMLDPSKIKRTLADQLEQEYRATVALEGVGKAEQRLLKKRLKKELKGIRSGRGRGNMRLSGDYSLSSKSKNIHGQIKGDVNFAGLDAASIKELLAKETNPDRIRYLNMALEQIEDGTTILVGSTNVVADTVGVKGVDSLLSITPYGPEEVVRTNIMALAGNPDIFDMTKIGDDALERIESSYASLENGVLPEGYVQHIRELASLSEYEIYDATRGAKDSEIARNALRQSIEEARVIAGGIDSGMPVTTNPYLTSLLQESIFRYSVNPAKGGGFEVDNAIRGHFLAETSIIGQEGYAKRYLSQKESQLRTVTYGEDGVRQGGLKPGYLTKDIESGSWVFGDVQDAEHLMRTLENLGGADFDDAMAGLFRYDPNNENALKVIGYRDPTARGELTMYNIAVDDQTLAERAVAHYRSAKPLLGIEDSAELAKIESQAKSINDSLEPLEKELHAQKGVARKVKARIKKNEQKIASLGEEDPEALAALAKEQNVLIERQNTIAKEIEHLEVSVLGKKQQMSRVLAKGMYPHLSEAESVAATYADTLGLEDKVLKKGFEGTDDAIAPTLIAEKELKEAAEDTLKKASKASLTPEEYVGRLILSGEGEAILGQALNYDASIDALFSSYADSSADNFLFKGLDPKSIKVFSREPTIDIIKQEGGNVAEYIIKEMEQGGELIGEELARAHLEEGRRIMLPYSMVNGGEDMASRYPAHFRRGIEAGLEKGTKAYNAAYGTDVAIPQLDDFTGTLMEDVTHQGAALRYVEKAKELQENFKAEIKASGVVEDAHAYTSSMEGIDDIADNLVDFFKHRRGKIDEYVGEELGMARIQRMGKLNDEFIDEIFKTVNEYARDFGGSTVDILDEILMSVKSSAVDRDVLTHLLGLGSATEGNRNLSSILIDTHLKRLGKAAKDSSFIAEGQRGVESGLSAEAAKGLKERAITAGEIEGAGIGSTSEAVLEAVKAEGGKTARIPSMLNMKEGITKLLEIPGARKVAVAAAVAVAGSALYQHRKDTTTESNSGGDFLPGGSNYESGYSRSRIATPSRSFDSGGGSGGKTYIINARGAHDPDALLGSLEGIVGTQAYGTISSRHNPNFDIEQAISDG